MIIFSKSRYTDSHLPQEAEWNAAKHLCSANNVPRQYEIGLPVKAVLMHKQRTTKRGLVDAEHELFEGNLTYSIMVLANLIGRNTSNRTLAKSPLNVNEWRVLRVASIFGPVCAADVISTLAMDKTTVSRAITSLHNEGLVDLSPNPQDRRQTLFQLTKKGRTLHGEIAPIDEAIDKSFEDLLTPTEIAYFHKIMRKLRPFAQRLVEEKTENIKSGLR